MSLDTSATRRMFSTRSWAVKPRSLLSPVPDVVAVEQIGVSSGGGELLLDAVGDGGFARARETREPQHARLLPFEP